VNCGTSPQRIIGIKVMAHMQAQRGAANHGAAPGPDLTIREVGAQ